MKDALASCKIYNQSLHGCKETYSKRGGLFRGPSMSDSCNGLVLYVSPCCCRRDTIRPSSNLCAYTKINNCSCEYRGQEEASKRYLCIELVQYISLSLTIGIVYRANLSIVPVGPFTGESKHSTILINKFCAVMPHDSGDDFVSISCQIL
jgi:hypothetical protein